MPGTPDGVSAWGSAGFSLTEGELGNGTTTGSEVPVSVSGLRGVTAISGGRAHGLALLSNGTVMAWGAGTDGQLGDERKTNSDVPVPVSGLTGVTAIAAGADFSLALLANGTVMAWGENRSGQLGNGTETRSYVPVAVSGLSGVTAIAAGFEHSLAVLSNGTVMAWGENATGELGNGTATRSDVPVPVSGLSGATSVAGGNGYSLARLSNGTVMAWGSNSQGELGNGTTTGSEIPVQVSGLSTATAVAAGFEHSLALLSNGAVMAWGGNGYGQLGNGTTTKSDVPVQVSGLTTATAIAAGYWHSLAALSNGTVVDWGDNEHGQLGNGTKTGSAVPVEVSGLRGAAEVAGGYSYSLALNPPMATVTSVEPTGGPTTGGTAVTLTGTSFGAATAVKFGSAEAASFTVNSETSITAVSPPGTGSVDITVSTPGGTSAPGSSDKFTYGLSVSKVAPGAGPPAGGTSVTLSGAGFAEATAVMFGSSSASFTVESENRIKAVSPPGTGVVNVTVTTPAGTSATSSADQFSYAPIVTGISPKGGEASGGTPVTITGVNFAGATAVKFGASNAGTFKVESENTIKAVSPPGTGDVEVSVTTAGGTSPASESDLFEYFGPSTCTPHETERPVVTSVQPTSGPGAGGNSVTIKGENFYTHAACEKTELIRVYPVVKVMFGNEEAINYKLETFGKEGPGEVVAIAPPGSGTVDVTVETFTTSLTKASDQYSYAASAPPTVANVEANHGPPAGGTSVTITGTNLTGATAVKFGSRTATSFTVNSQTSITAVAPPWGSGDGVAEVTVTTPAGTSALSLGDSFVYEPTVTKVEPSSGRASGGTTVAISGAAFEGVYTNGSGERPPFVKSVKFGSTNATSFKLEPTGQISAVAPPGSGTVDVTVTTEGGTSPTSTADHFTYEPIRTEFKNWVVSGGLGLKKINQPIMLPAGATFNGSAALNPQTLSWPLTGLFAIPSFNVVVKILGVPATIGLEFSEVGSVEGSIELSRRTPGDLSLSVPTKENVAFTTIGILGIRIATKCHTTEPLSLPLVTELPGGELLTTGAHFMGTTTMPPVSCEGKNATLESAVLTALFSGSSNPYSIAIAPPA
jgi:alpha-tubulin suppressor-like RCC1 family protein